MKYNNRSLGKCIRHALTSFLNNKDANLDNIVAWLRSLNLIDTDVEIGKYDETTLGKHASRFAILLTNIPEGSRYYINSCGAFDGFKDIRSLLIAVFEGNHRAVEENVLESLIVKGTLPIKGFSLTQTLIFCNMVSRRYNRRMAKVWNRMAHKPKGKWVVNEIKFAFDYDSPSFFNYAKNFDSTEELLLEVFNVVIKRAAINAVVCELDSEDKYDEVADAISHEEPGTIKKLVEDWGYAREYADMF